VTRIPFPLPRYTFIDSDGALWVSVPAQEVARAYVTLFIAGVALVDGWQRQPRGVIVGDLRQMVLPLAG
jgi:hypothetical protein